MAAEIKMPQLSDTMHAGKILAWRKNIGDKIARGDILAEVETEKANLEIESFHEGILLKVLVPALTSAKVGEVIALIGKAGEDVSAISNNPAIGSPAPATTTVKTENSPTSSQRQPTAAVPPASNGAAKITNDAQGRIKVSPLARRIAQDKNIDLNSLKGTGPDGRIVRKDVEHLSGGVAVAATPVAHQAPRSEPSLPRETSANSGKLSPLSKMRETIAKRMQESVTQAPHFYVTASIAMDEVVRLKEILKERSEYKGLSLNHFIIKAAAYALEREPRVNCAIKDNQVFTPDNINVGIITAIEDGLLIPVIREANRLSLKDVVFEARAAVERARAGRPSSTDLVGGTFSISNMGMFDVENFTAIINPGQGAILAVSSVREEPVVVRGHITVGLRMRATLSVDHRIIDGVMAGTFQKYFKEALETPALLMA